jgi:anti-sigma factor RsiW
MKRNPHRHLTDKELVNYVLEELSEEAEEALDQHLTRCEACAQQVEEFYTAQDAFPAAQWATQRNAFLSALQQRLVSSLPAVQRMLARLRDFLAPVSYRLALAPQFGTRREPWDCESEDGRFGVFVREVNGDVTVHVSAQGTALEGVMLRFSAGTWHHDVSLERVADNQVRATLLLARDARAALPQDAVLCVSLIGDDPETGRTDA